MEGFVFFIVVIFALLCGLVYILPYVIPFVIIIVVIVAIGACISMGKFNELIRNITEEPFRTCKIKPFAQYSTEELRDKMELYDNSAYFNEFSKTVRKHGEIYFYEDRIDKYECVNNLHKCKVLGTNEYDVSIEVDDNGTIINKECNCQGFKKGYNCKHIYALLYSLNCSENKNKIILNLETELLPASRIMIKNFEKHSKKLYKHSKEEIKHAINSFYNTDRVVTEELKKLRKDYVEETVLNVAKSIYDAIFDIRLSILEVLRTYGNKSKGSDKTYNNVYSANNTKDDFDLGKWLLERKKIEWLYGGKEPTAFEKRLITLNHIVEEKEREERELEELLNEDDDEF